MSSVVRVARRHTPTELAVQWSPSSQKSIPLWLVAIMMKPPNSLCRQTGQLRLASREEASTADIVVDDGDWLVFAATTEEEINMSLLVAVFSSQDFERTFVRILPAETDEEPQDKPTVPSAKAARYPLPTLERVQHALRSGYTVFCRWSQQKAGLVDNQLLKVQGFKEAQGDTWLEVEADDLDGKKRTYCMPFHSGIVHDWFCAEASP